MKDSEVVTLPGRHCKRGLVAANVWAKVWAGSSSKSGGRLNQGI